MPVVLPALGTLGLATGTAGADAPRVVASIKPVHALVAGVMEHVGEPTLLVKGAGSPHSYSLRPSEARALDEAEIVFWIGEGLETFLVKPLEALSADAVVVELAEAPGVELLPAREGGTWERHDHDHDHHADEPAEHAEAHDEDHADGEGHGDHDDDHADEHAGHNLHFWLDPQNAAAMVETIAFTLGEVDPANASTYVENAARLEVELGMLDERLRERLEPVRDRPFVVFHDAYHYFERHYGLSAAGSITVSPERRPGARRLAGIRNRIEELGAVCVFAEPQFEPALVRTVTEGTGARSAVLDPLGADLEAGPEQYFELLEGLADALIACLDESPAD